MSLLYKELRQMLPWYLLLAALTVQEWLWVGIVGRIDEQTWLGLDRGLGTGGGGAQLSFAIALGFVVGMGLLPREYDEGTIHFLHSLPQSPLRVVLVKSLAGAIFVLGWTTVEDVNTWWLQSFNPQSISGNQFDLRTAVIDTLLTSLLSICTMCHALCLSFFRRLGLALYAVFWLLLTTLEDTVPAVSELSPARLLDHRYVHATLLVPVRAIALQCAVAAASYGLGLALWLTPADRVVRVYARVEHNRLGRALQTALGLLVLGIAIAMFDGVVDTDDDTDGSEHPEPTALLESRHYRFTYPAKQRGQLLDLVDPADRHYDTVAHALRVRSLPTIIADLTEQSDEHAGIASGHKLRMALSPFQERETVLSTLVHETTHVLASEAGGDGLKRTRQSVWSFDEGLADYMAFTMYPKPEANAARLQAAALSVQRDRMRLDDLLDEGQFLARYHEGLVYPLGQAWVEAWVDTCGEGVLAQLLTEMAAPDFPLRLAGKAFWQELSLRTGCGWGRVTSAYRERIDAAAEVGETVYRDLPKPIAHLEHKPEATRLVVALDPPVRLSQLSQPLVLQLLMRRDATASRGAIFYFEATPGLADEDGWHDDTTGEGAQTGARSTRQGLGAELDAGVLDAGQDRSPDASDPGKGEAATDPWVRECFDVPDALSDGPFEYLLSLRRANDSESIHTRWTRTR